MFPIIFSSDQSCDWFSSYLVFSRSVLVITRPSQLNYCFGSENAQNLYAGIEIYVICPQLKYVGMTMYVNNLTSIYSVILYVKYTLKHTLYRHHFWNTFQPRLGTGAWQVLIVWVPLRVWVSYPQSSWTNVKTGKECAMCTIYPSPSRRLSLCRQVWLGQFPGGHLILIVRGRA